ncbi:MAG: 2-oxo-4-hydroxy-4-carboxy-5-ureidoimidazoline decarboxylase [Cyanobacteria bacterium J06643_4]
MTYSIDQVNQMGQAAFVALFGAVFEETPGVASRVWCDRPFQNVAALHRQMVAVVEKMTTAEQVKLIQAHPELGKRGQMAEASVQEQAGAGLSQLNADDYERIQALNHAYREKFGFPFVMAVKGLNHSDILAAFESRLAGDETVERARSLSEIYKIARFRLDDLVSKRRAT